MQRVELVDKQDERTTPTGVFVLEVLQRGKLIERIVEHNLIVDTARQVHARLLGGAVAGLSVTQFGVGTNASAPAPGNTGLTGAYLKPVDAVSYPAPNQVSFTFSLGALEANGKAIQEFGLLTASGTLYARKVRAAALNKDTDLSFQGSWTISF